MFFKGELHSGILVNIVKSRLPTAEKAKGGRFPALEDPEGFIDDIREFVTLHPHGRKRKLLHLS